MNLFTKSFFLVDVENVDIQTYKDIVCLRKSIHRKLTTRQHKCKVGYMYVSSRRNIFYFLSLVEAGVNHDVPKAPPPPPPAAQALAVKLKSLEPGARHATVLGLQHADYGGGKHFMGIMTMGILHCNLSQETIAI